MADSVGRQTVLGLVVPGLLCLVAGTVCAFYAFLVGVSLIAFGTLLLLLSAAACRIVKSLPDQAPSDDSGSSKKGSHCSLTQDPRTTYGSRNVSGAYVNPAFEPKEDELSSFTHLNAISCERLHCPQKQQPQQPCHPPSVSRKFASTNSLVAELHGGGRYLHSTKESLGNTGFRHIEFDPESGRFGEQPPRYSAVVRESPLI